MKIFKLCSAITAAVVYSASIFVFFFTSFIDLHTVVLGKGNVTHLAKGYEIAFGQTNLDSSNTLGTLFAFIFMALGLLAAIYAIASVFVKKSKKANINLKLLCACCSFVVCGIVPAVLFFLTLQTTGTAGGAGDLGAGLLGAETKLGVGAVLCAIFSLVGAAGLGAAEIK